MANKRTEVLSLEIVNLKKIEDLKLELHGRSLMLKGVNDIGKSTVIQGLMIACDVQDLPPNPVTYGKEKGHIKTTFKGHDGNIYNVRIDFTNEKFKFTFTNQDNMPIGKPKTILDQMIGPFIDIFKVIEDGKTADGRRKNEKMFLKLANLDAEKVYKFDADIKTKENNRLDVGRKVSVLKGVVDEYKDLDTIKYADEIKLDKLYDQFNVDLQAKTLPETEAHTLKADKLKEKKDKVGLMTKLADIKEKGNARALDVTSLDNDIKSSETLLSEIHSLELQLKNKRDELYHLEEKIKKQQEAIKGATTVVEYREQYDKVTLEIKSIDEFNDKVISDADILFENKLQEIKEANKKTKETLTAALQKEVEDASYHNKQHANVVLLRERKNDLETQEIAYEDLTGLINQDRTDRHNYIMSGSFPIPGMEYTDEGIKYMGMLLDEGTMSTSIIIDLGIKLANAYNPKGLNVIVVPNAVLLDKNNRAKTEQYLQDNDLIGIYEMVDDSHDEVVIEFIERSVV